MTCVPSEDSDQSDQSSLCAQWVTKDPRFLHADREDSDQTGRTADLGLLGAQVILLVLSSCSSFWDTCSNFQGVQIVRFFCCYFFNLGFMASQDYFTHFEPSQSLGGGENGRSLKKTT